MVALWQARFNRPFNFIAGLLVATGVLRLMFMALPGNDWSSLVPPQPMGLYRNLFLMVQGAGVILLILIAARQVHDRLFQLDRLADRPLLPFYTRSACGWINLRCSGC